MVISSPCLTDIKNWLVQSKRLLLASPKQTALGKDFSNPLIVDSLLKTIWLSMHHVVTMKHWLFQSKRLLIYSMAGEDEFHDDNPLPPPPVTPTQQASHTLSTIKLPILKKGEYDIWAMKMEHYLGHTDYPIWEVILKGNGPIQVSTDTNGQIRVLPPKIAEEILAREREIKARTTLLMFIPEDHLAKFHKIIDAKEMWEAIKSRFSGNDESKKMQKYILKQQFESFFVSNSEGLHKGYDRFQSLLRQLEIHGAGVSTEDANQKFVRSLPASWSQVSLIMRTKPGVDTLSFDDLYNNLSGSNSNDPQKALKNKGIVDSGCSRHMTGNKAYLVEYQNYNGGPVAFGGSKGQITGKGKIITGKLNFKDVYFMKELKQFNLFSVSQMCDKKNKVLFTDSECLVLSPDFKLPDENQVLLRVPRQNNMYSFNLENIVPTGGLACLIAKATVDESNKWHRRLGHVNFKNLNKLVKGNLVRGLPSKIFQNDHTCVACQKGKQHKASCKAKVVSSISQPLQLLHMDLFGPTSVRSINHKTYCLVITDDFSRFSWVFFLRTKDETSGILKDFIRQIENQLNQKVKTIRCDNGTEFKNRDIIEFCGSKGIKREYSNARTPQQNGVAERKNRTLIEAARTMLADSFLPNTFWAEAVSTACYVLNRVLVTKPQNKTPYELITGKIPIISYIRPFGCHVTILNTIDHLGKFEEKFDEGFLVWYSLNSKAFRVYNLETKRVEENLHINFLENKPNVTGKGPNWLFDLDYLTDSMNYQPVIAENKANKTAGPKEANHSAVKSSEVKNGDEKPNGDTDPKTNKEPTDQEDQAFLEELERLKRQEKEANDTAEAFRKDTPISTASPSSVFSTSGPDLTNNDQDDSQIPALEDIYDNPSDEIFTNASYDDEGTVADFTNLETTVNVSPIPTSRIHSIHPITQILGDPTSAVQT
ncbi:putative ribonuclease H-like domain-containing protein [Tanacetum coccineum]